jgi:hypothetical protein
MPISAQVLILQKLGREAESLGKLKQCGSPSATGRLARQGKRVQTVEEMLRYGKAREMVGVALGIEDDRRWWVLLFERRDTG